jgi:hypothetical protein
VIGRVSELVDTLEAYSRSRVVMTGVELSVFDAIGPDGNTTAAVATTVALDERLTHRLLRALASLGLCSYDGARWSLTAVGLELTSRESTGLRELVLFSATDMWQLWTQLTAALRAGVPPREVRPFDEFVGDATAYNRFEAQMRLAAQHYAPRVAAALPLGVQTHVVDVGGGSGVLACAVLRQAPGASVIIADRAYARDNAAAYVRATLPTAWDDERIRFVDADFFRELPAGADLYVLTKVIHDWDDPAALSILETCRRACRSRSQIAVYERALPERVAPGDKGFIGDLNTWLLGGGSERTADELVNLLRTSGFAEVRVQPLARHDVLVTGALP